MFNWIALQMYRFIFMCVCCTQVKQLSRLESKTTKKASAPLDERRKLKPIEN